MRIKSVIPFIMILMIVSAVHAEESDIDNTLSASASSSATGIETYANAEAVYSDNKVMAISQASAKGEDISLSSRASAQGVNVHGEGGVSATGRDTRSSAEVIVDKINEKISRITVIVKAIASGDASGYTYAFAYADDGNVDRVVIQEKPVFRGGFVFGKSDAERYYHFKNQVNISCSKEDNKSKATCLRANYYLEILKDDYRVNATQFENKYTLQNVIKMNPSLVDRK